MKVAALVILYNFGTEVINNIDSYINQVDKVYAFDNSDSKDDKLVDNLINKKKIEYIDGCGNKGLSLAINYVAKKALKEDFEWLITFDQDSIVKIDMLDRMRKFLNSYVDKERIGLIGPIVNDGKMDFGIPVTKFSYYDKIIQSGALHNLRVWKELGGYDKNLFIDQVDFEYCIRVREKGYLIIRLNQAELIHNVEDVDSNIEYVNGKKLTINKYSPYRYYYIIRNNLYLIKKYRNSDYYLKEYYISENQRNISSIIRGFLVDRTKIRKGKAIFWAFWDYVFINMGKCRRKL